MKYFFDTKFIEGFTQPFFGKSRHFIDLISIGIVVEDGREYYAISNEFDPKKASKWIKENVIEKLEYREPVLQSRLPGVKTYLEKVYEGMEAVKKAGKSNDQIAQEIIDFVNPPWLQEPFDWHSEPPQLTQDSQDFITLHNAILDGEKDVFQCYIA